MKVEVLKTFFDNSGLHRVGDVVEVENLDERIMKPIVEKINKTDKAEKVVKKVK